MAKRRLEMQVLRKENQTTTSKKHDKKCIDKGSDQEPTNLNFQLQKVKDANDKLKDENDRLKDDNNKLKNENSKQLEKIKELESTINILEDEKREYDSQPKIARTTTGELILFCAECEFPADDLYDLGEHMYEYHTEGEKGKITCHFCDEKFETKDSVMRHRKSVHKDKVKQCIYFSSGKCNYGDDLCWFNHHKSVKSPLDEDIDIECRYCEKSFVIRSEFMYHRMKYHSERVPLCRNFLSGKCEFSSCWFKHTENEEIKSDQDITKNLVDMMEKFTEELSEIKQRIGNTDS